MNVVNFLCSFAFSIYNGQLATVSLTCLHKQQSISHSLSTVGILI